MMLQRERIREVQRERKEARARLVNCAAKSNAFAAVLVKGQNVRKRRFVARDCGAYLPSGVWMP